MKKKLFFILFLVSILYKPLNGYAAPPFDFDKDVPEGKGYYVRFLDHEGNAFPDPITMDAREIRTYGPPSGASFPSVELNNDPVTFTTKGDPNVFYYDTKGYEYKALTVAMYQHGIADWKLTIPGNYVKYFSTTPPSGVGLIPDLHVTPFPNLSNTYEQKTSVWSNTTHDFQTWPNSAWTGANARWTEQTDGSYLLTQGRHMSGPTSKVAAEIGYILVSVNVNSNVRAQALRMGTDGQGFTVYAYNKEIKEIFEDETGSSIDAPSGYTNGKTTAITSNPFTYTMEDGDKLPQTYTIGNQLYSYQGWYKGSGNKAQMKTAYPPDITFEAEFDESKDEVHIVYKKVTAVNLTEKYVTESGSQIESSWDTVTPVEKGAAYTEQPEATKTDNSGTVWEYQGWKLSTQPVGTVTKTPVSLPMTANTEVHYIYAKKQYTVTEKWVDKSTPGSLLGITPNPDTSKKAASNSTYTYTPDATITDSSGHTWSYAGWENVTDDPGTIHPITTPVSLSNVSENMELVYHYSKQVTTGTLTLLPDNEIVNNGDDVLWNGRLTNTGSHAMKDLTIKKTDQWAQGLAAPDQIIVTTFGSVPKTFTITPTEWENGVVLTDVIIPSGGGNQSVADIILRSTKASGTHNQVLPAEVEVNGNLTDAVKGQSFVRIDDPDEPNLQQTGDVTLINLPDFKFGTVGTSPRGQTKALDAKEYIRDDYYPYIRFKDQSTTNGNWTVSVQLGTFSDGVNTLPSSTHITLEQGKLKKITDFNEKTESLQNSGAVNDQTLYSDNTSVLLLESAEKGVYQVEYDMENVKLNLPRTTGVSLGKNYHAQLKWNLATGP